MRSTNNAILINLREKFSNLNLKKNHIEINLFQSAKKIREQKKTLDRKIQKQDYFIWNLHHNPQNLVTTLHAEVLKVLDYFDANYSLITYSNACDILCKLQLHVEQINEKTNELISQGSLDNVSMRSQYLQYCGLLCMIINSLESDNNKISQILRTQIGELLAKTQLPLDGDFPDELATGYNSIRYFNLHNANVDGLTCHLAQLAYSVEIKDKLSALLCSRRHLSRKLFQHAKEIINNFIRYEDINQECQAGNDRFNIIVMKATYNLLQDPYNVTLQNHYLKLADSAYGCPTTRKKLTACMFSFLGGVLILGCLYLAAVSFGILAPVAIAGISTIITTFSSGVLGFATFVGMGSGAYLSISKGLKLFDNNARHGVSLKMTELAYSCRLSSARRHIN